MKGQVRFSHRYILNHFGCSLQSPVYQFVDFFGQSEKVFWLTIICVSCWTSSKKLVSVFIVVIFFKSLLLSKIFHLISPPWYPNANQYFQLLFLDIVSLTSFFLGLCPPKKQVLPSISCHLSRSGSKGWRLSRALTLHPILNHLLKLT